MIWRNNNKPVLAALALLAATAVSALAAPAVQAEFEPIPAGQRALYRFDFTRFFKDEADYQATTKKLDQLVSEITALKGKVIASPANLHKAMLLSDDFTRLFSRAYWYLDLQYSVNTKQTELRSRATDLETKYGPALAFVNDEIKEITRPTLDRYVKELPALETYRWVLEESLRYKPHTLSLKEEELLARTAPLMTNWQAEQYELLMDRASWGKVTDPSAGELDVRQDAGRINNSPVREVRQAGYEKENAAYKAQRDLFAFDLVNVVKTRNELAQLRGHRNAQASAFFNLHLTYDDVESAYNQIIGHGDLYKRFQTLRRDRVASFTGYDTVRLFDMSMVPPGVEKPRFNISEATGVIKRSVAYLGREYQAEMSDLLDPKQGRLDLVAGPNRVPNAFAIPSPGMESVFYSYAYEGYLNDVNTLAHEGGHVVHHAIQENAKVPPALSDGPRYFTEAFAMLNELVLNDMLYRQATEPGLKVYYLEQHLQNMLGFYGTTRIAAIEKAIYEGIDKGTLKTADDFDAVTQDFGRRTSIWFDREPDAKILWQQIPHLYSSPNYYVNYVFADLLAQTFFAQFKKDPAGFADRFVSLMKAGFNDSPHVLLKRFMDIELKDPKTYEGVFNQQKAYLDDLEALYRQVPVRKMQTASR